MSSNSPPNYSQSLLHEVRKFYKNSNQLNILLKETNNACKELKSVQQTTPLPENIEHLQINQLDESFIKDLPKKRVCFVIMGQNVLAKSVLVNELLSRYLLPFQITSNLIEEKWKFIRIKYAKLNCYTYQLVDSEFELMSPEQVNKKFVFGAASTVSGSSSRTSSTSRSSSTSPISMSNPLASSPTNFCIPVEDLRLDTDLARAHDFVDQATNESELNHLTEKLKQVESLAENQAILEINLDHKLLEQGVEILVYSKQMSKLVFEKLMVNMLPIYVYGIIENKLSEQDIKELNEIRTLIDKNPVLFVKIPEIDRFLSKTAAVAGNKSPLSSSPITTTSNSSPLSANLNFSPQVAELAQQQQHTAASSSQNQAAQVKSFLKYLLHSSVSNSQQQQQIPASHQSSNTFTIFAQLCELNLLNIMPSSGNAACSIEDLSYFYDFSWYAQQQNMSETSRPPVWSQVPLVIESELCEKWHMFMPALVSFSKRYLKSFSVRGTTILFKFHEYCLSKFINFAFEMARDLAIMPRKIEYAKEKEQILFESLNSLASLKQEELKNLISTAIESNREQILEASRNYEFVDVELTCSGESSSGSNSLENSTEEKQRSSSHLSSGEYVTVSRMKRYVTCKYARDYKKCTSQIQELVLNKLNNAIGQKLIESVEILKENYIGTLKRCLKTLEDANNITIVDTNSASVSEALQQILNAAYQVEVNLSGSSNIVRLLIQRMKELIKNMPWSASPILDEDWKVSIASNMLDSLSESKLARILCQQMRERLRSSHSLFITSLRLLETKHTGRLEKTEENQTLIRKILAPKFAKLCLESTSLKDYVLYGFPMMGKEIGRGQYGVVYSCQKWGKFDNLAVKSVVPPDEKHWNDLALEFHYTKQIADHERIVKLIGSVIDYSYGNGQSPAVLLIMESMKRDLYSALKSGLDWKTRIRISLDVVDGIRYLHSLGLVHRDIKLKNVLLDSNNRAKITDLGFCKPEAMMSGSIVGTPVHMCPEMFDSKYDNTVDIYAFGILFWYICAGSVMLPKNFEQCNTKDDLWTSVKRGVRPERLAVFDNDCWSLMEQCWKHDPKQRPHIGVIATQLTKINAKYNETS